jgi:hypothetical protein
MIMFSLSYLNTFFIRWGEGEELLIPFSFIRVVPMEETLRFNLYSLEDCKRKLWVCLGGLGRAPAPPKTALALAPSVEWLFWWSESRFKKMFGKTASSDCLRVKCP